MFNRRDFLKLAIALGFLPAPKSLSATSVDFEILLANVVLARSGYLPSHFKIWQQSFHQAMAIRPQNEQDDLKRVLTLIEKPWARWAIGGSFGRLSENSLEQMLQSWRTSRIFLLRRAYSGLVSLAQSSWYALPESWPAIKYPGPVERWWS